MTIKGLIIKNISNSFVVKTDSGDYNCLAQGKLKQNGKVVVGDRVDFDVVKGNFGCITKVDERKNCLVRPPISNVDNLVIVFATIPEPDYVLIDKLILICLINDIKPILCINKSDLIDDDTLNKIHTYYDQVVLDMVVVSAKQNNNLEALKSLLKGKINAFAGQSAVGKSTLLNALIGQDYAQTGEVSQKTNRGKNTTRHTQMYEIMPDTYVCDTPGFSMLNLNGVIYDNLSYYYPDFGEFRCKYTGCSHTKEGINDCAIKQAVKDNKINPDRYTRYLKIYEELRKVNKYGKL